MKLLVVSASPLQQAGDTYYAVDPWIHVPLQISEEVERVTLWAPVKRLAEGESPAPHSWSVPLGRLEIAPYDYYSSFVAHYRLWLRRVFRWRYQANQLAAAHDVVVIRHPSPMVSIAARAARRQGKPMVMMVMSNVEMTDRVLGNSGMVAKLYLGLAKLMVAQEVSCAKNARRVYAYSKLLAHRHRNCRGRVTLMQDPLLSEKDFLERVDTCQSDEVRLLRVSWIQPLKGLEYLLEAQAMLLNQGFRVRLEIVGRERKPNYQQKLEEQSQMLGIQESVEFSGWIPYDRIREVYARSDIQVISSLTEGTPRCIAEGAARGLPLVSTRAGGCADVLTHEVNALLVEPAEPRAMAKAIERLIKDGQLRREIIKNGYAFARDATFETLGRRFLGELSEIAKD